MAAPCSKENEDVDLSMAGKVAVVTGASMGIGRAVALAFAREGARVVVADVVEEGAQETVRLVREAGSQGAFVRADVSSLADVQGMVNQAVQLYGRLDYACNNAGIGGAQAPTGQYPEDAWDKVIAVNLTGVFLCCKYEIQQMLKNGGGAIVNMASILGQVGFAQSSAYVSAKHGVVGLTKNVALEYATQGIRCNAVCPAFIVTPLLERAGLTTDPALNAWLVGLHPVKRLGQPEEVAGAVVWLCSDRASFVTGEAMLIDGGYVAQ